MPEEVTLSKDEGIIHVRSFGKITLDDWRASLEQVMKYVESTGISSVLVDATEQKQTPTTMGIHEFGSHLPQGVSFAIVLSQDTAPDQKFLETVGKNRGKCIQVFADDQEALRWLKDGA